MVAPDQITSRARNIRLLALFLVLAAIPLYCIPALRSESRCDVTPADCPFDVPSDAKHVCYYRRGVFGPNSFCEFDVSPESFLAWAQASGWNMKPITSPPYTIRRYAECPHGRKSGDASTPHQISILRGFWFDEMSDGDTGMHIAYDLDSGRANWHRQTR